MKDYKVKLRNGSIVIGDEFEASDYDKIKNIFKKWLDTNNDLKSLKGRTLNVPDVVSEGLFCIAFDAVRTNSTHNAKSYDCVMKLTGEGVQVKSASISNDLTSFGPKSTWDLLYFMDFAPNGFVDGNVSFYKIEAEDVYNLVLNKSKKETFLMQQEQGRRPRFSIQKSIIKAKGLKPVKTMNLLE